MDQFTEKTPGAWPSRGRSPSEGQAPGGAQNLPVPGVSPPYPPSHSPLEQPEPPLEGEPAVDEAGASRQAPPAPLDPEEFAESIGLTRRQLLRSRARPSLKHTYRKPQWEPRTFTPQERLLLLDTWTRSGLPAGDFAALVGLSKHTLYLWKKLFKARGPAGLMDQPRGGPRGSKLPELTKRTILMLKETNPDWGCQRVSDMLLRGPALPASPSAVARVLREAGYEAADVPTHPHPPRITEFEREKPNELWQTDIFTFVLRRQNRRLYLVAFMDDHSRFIVSYGLSASPTAAWVIDVFRAGVSNYQEPTEVLTDNGPQYITWRGKSLFARELEARGIRHIVARPRRPQTLGKIERFWGSLWRECVQKAVFLDLQDAQRRVGFYIDYHNLQRPHQGIGGVVPADRFFRMAPEVLRTLKERAAANALSVARNGEPRKPFYLTGNADGKPFSVHAEGERVILRRGGGEREEIDLNAQAPGGEDSPPAAEKASQIEDLPAPLCPTTEPLEDIPAAPPSPGVSALDEVFGVGIEDVNVGPMVDDTPSDDSQEKGDPANGIQ